MGGDVVIMSPPMAAPSGRRPHCSAVALGVPWAGPEVPR